ncbi:MAG: G-D-S-L family lipolytic protein [Cloacibacterium sp.]|nr:G-D-S-L family lipolytic protein [Cloacibacterium sp.]
MKKIFISTLAISSLLFTVGCKTDFDTDVRDVTVTKGEADFTRYVALGNSLTAGFRDNALYADGQNESYPNIIAGQMKLAGGGAFKQPMIPNNIGGFTDKTNYPGKLTLQIINGSLAPVASVAAAALDNVSSGAPYQNLGVPGAKSFHLGISGYGALNPYYQRFAIGNNASPIKDAVAQSPTFFSLWIGNNDVLSYATSGGVGVDQSAAGNINPATYGYYDITHPAVYENKMKEYLTQLTAGNAKGVIANIPSVTSIPFFTTVPPMPITGLTTAQAAQLNAAYAQYNTALAAYKSLIGEAEYQKRLIKFTAGAVANGAVIVDKDLDNKTAPLPKYRQTTAKDFILLSTSSALKAGGGTVTQLTDAQVLTEVEAGRVAAAVTAYNASLKSLATQFKLAFVDANAKMVELSSTSGLQFDGVKYSANFVTGGSFSLDGVHLTGRGYAVIANEFIKAINAQYKSTLPQVNPNNYSGVTFPK